MNEEYSLTLTGTALVLSLRQLRKAGVAETPVPIVVIKLSKTIPLALLRAIGTDLAAEKLVIGNRNQPVVLPRRLGRRLTIVMLELRPIKQGDRMDSLATRLREMPDEEISYWLGWLGRYGADDLAQRSRVLRALRYLVES